MNVQIDLIAAATRIPKRILMGSERGELASGQDEVNWMKHISGRQNGHCELVILRPFIDRLIEIGILPKPTDAYTCEWPDMLAPSDKEKVEIGAIRAKALKDYNDSPGAEDLLPPTMMYSKILYMTDAEIKEIEELQSQMIAQETTDMQPTNDGSEIPDGTGPTD
jgi:hypothetical protein